MSVYKDTAPPYCGRAWKVDLRYRDWQNKLRRYQKRGFATKKEALKHEQMIKAQKTGSTDTNFDDFIEIYFTDLTPRIKASTMETKRNIINTHIRPYFGDKNIHQITNRDVIQWENELTMKVDKNGKKYSPVFLRTVANQLSAIMNHAVRYYGLKENPYIRVDKRMGGNKADKEVEYWTQEEFETFQKAMISKPISYYAFEILFWTGIRMGELFALQLKDIDLENKRLMIDETLSVIRGEVVVTAPKTDSSTRVITLPQFVADDLEDYIESIYGLEADSRLFEISKSYLHHEMDRGVKETGVKRIKIHGLRHSHVALLIHLGYSAEQIQSRTGHSDAEITRIYRHIYPSTQIDMAESLNNLVKKE